MQSSGLWAFAFVAACGPTAPTTPVPPAAAASPTERTSDPVDETPLENSADLYGDPLPEGAFARLGTTRLADLDGSPVAFSPDGRQLISCADGKITSWDSVTGRFQRAFARCLGRVVFRTPSSILARTPDHHIEEVDSESGEVLRTLEHGEVRDFVLGGDGRDVLLVRSSGQCPLVEVDSGRVLTAVPCHVASQRASASLSPDGRWIASDRGDHEGRRRIGVFSRDGGEAFEIVLEDRQVFTDFAFAPDGASLAVSVAGGTPPHGVDVWSVEEGRMLRSIPAPFPGRLAFAAEGTSLAVSAERCLTVFDWATSKMASTRCSPEPERDDRLSPYGTSYAATALALSPDGRFLGAAGLGSLRVFDLRAADDDALRPRPDSQMTQLQFAAGGAQIVAASDDGDGVWQWDARTGRLLGVWNVKVDWKGTRPVLAASEAADVVAVLRCRVERSRRSDVRSTSFDVWSTPDGRRRDRWNVDLRGREERPRGFALSADGRVAALLTSGGVYIIDPTTGRTKERLEISAAYEGIALGPQGAHVALWGKQSAFLDVESGVETPIEASGSLTPLQDGRFVEVSRKGTVASWSPDAPASSALGEVRGVQLPAAAGAEHVALVRRVPERDGQQVEVWNIEREDRVFAAELEHRAVATALSADGAWLAVSGDDRNIVVWRVR